MRLCSILSACLISGTLASPGIAQTQSNSFSDNEINLGVLTDMSGVYSDFAGKGSVTAVQMAVEDFGGAVNGVPVKVVYADHLNKADVGASIARQWYDVDKVDAIFDTSNSAVSLAVIGITEEKDRVVIIGGSSTTRITTDSCTPNSIQYVYDANSLSNVTAKALIAQGAKTWYFVTVDFAFGHGLEKATADVVKEAGGKVLGAVRHPLNATDFASFMVQAQSSGAQVIALANGGTDMVNAIKTANQFGIGSGKQRVASLLTFVTDVHSMGLAEAKDIMLTEAFYWDLNDETRKWSRRFFERNKRMPTMVQAGMYSATMHYLKALQANGGDNAKAVMKTMKATPVNDFFAKNGKIRQDGLHVHDMYLMQVKQPSESKYPWDYYKVKSIVPESEAFSPMSPACKLVR